MGETRRVASVSVDLDPIDCYYRIHALGAPPAELGDVILRRSVPRYLEVFARHGVRATFFVVGSDLAGAGATAEAARALVREIVAAGPEVGNHSFSHPYEMARLDADRVRDEVGRAHEEIAAAAGIAPVGFRAPGYDISATMLDELARRSYLYDSSIFPAPGYYAAKALVMAGLRLAGHKSGAVMTNPRALAAPPRPYRPASSAPWRRGQSPLVELPIAVTPFLRVPAIGTSLLLAPAPIRRGILDAMRGRRFFNFELHGIDLCDADLDGFPPALVARQPDLRATLAAKQRALEEALDKIRTDFEFAPLKEVAAEAQRGAWD